MIELNINIERFNENGICLGCLNYNRKMFRHDAGNYNIKAFFKLLANFHVPDDLDIKVCWECYAAIRNVSRFQAQILKSYKYLSEYSQKQTFLLSPMDLTQYSTQRLTSTYFLESSHVSLPEQIDLEFTSETTKVELEDTNLSYYDGKDEEDVLREDEIYVPQEIRELQDGLKMEYDIEEVNYLDGEDLYPEQDITWKSKDVSEYTGQDYVTAEPLNINLTQQSNRPVKPRAACKRTKKPRAQRARKTGTQPDRIKEGLLLIRNGASLRTAEKKTGVCFITLRRYYWKTKDIPLEELLPSQLMPTYGRNKVFTPEQEIDLKNQFTHCSFRTTQEYLKRAYQYAKMNNLKMPVAWQETQKAGQDWWRSFKRRHKITPKMLETTAGDTASDKNSLNKFHENFQTSVTNSCQKNLRSGNATICDNNYILENNDIENKNKNVEIDLLLEQNNTKSKRAKTGRRKGNPHDKIKEGLLLIRNGASLRTAAKKSGVCFITLRRYYWKTKDIPLEELLPSQLTPNYGRNKVFTPEQEIALKNYFTHCACLTTKACLKVVYQCAKMNNLKMPARWKEKQMASQDWWNSFKRRHDITLKEPETSAGDTVSDKNSLKNLFEIFQTSVTNPCQKNLRSGNATICDNNYILKNKNKNVEIDLLLEQNNTKSKRAKTGRRKGNPYNKIKEGLLLIRNGKTLRAASKRTEVPFVTLSRYYWRTKDIPLEELVPSQLTPNFGRKKVFTLEQEIAFKNYFSHCACLTTKACLKVVYQCAKMNNLKMPARWKEKQMASQDWWNSFKRRHDITLKKPDTSAGDTAFNKNSLKIFFKIFQTSVTNLCQQNLQSEDATISDNNYILENKNVEIDLILEQNNTKSKRAKTGRRKGYSYDKIKEGLLLIRNGASLRTAAKKTGVCFITLRRYYWKTKDIPLEELLPSQLIPTYGRNKVFTPEQEIDLKNQFTHCALLFYDLTTKEYRKVAYQCAKMNNLKMPVSWQEKQMAGEEWWRSFKRRHNITLKKTLTNSAGDTACHNSNVDKFYDNLEELMSQSPNFADGTRIYNLGETTIVQKSQDVLAPSDRDIIEKETSEETRTLITTCCIVSATGNCVPPVMIFPRNKFKGHKIKKTPSETLELATSNGFMNSTIFPKAMEHFVRHTSASNDNPCILIMDDRESHLSLEALELAKNSGVHIVTVHCQTNAKLQPLEVGLYESFNSSYHAAMDSWMLRHPGKPVTITDLSEIAGSAFHMVMTPTNIADSFAKCGIFPYNRHNFTRDNIQPTVTISCRRDIEML